MSVKGRYGIGKKAVENCSDPAVKFQGISKIEIAGNVTKGCNFRFTKVYFLGWEKVRFYRLLNVTKGGHFKPFCFQE